MTEPVGTAKLEPNPQPTPSVSPNAAATPKDSESADAVSPGAAGGGVPKMSASDAKVALEPGGQKVIETFAKIAGLNELKSDGSHQGNVVNAGKVLAKLTQLGKQDPKMDKASSQFLNELATAGKGVYNWGLKLNGTPLNQLKAFNGVDAAQAAANKGATPGAESSAVGKDGAAAPKAAANASDGPAPQSGAKRMSPDEVRAAVTPVLKEVAALKGDASTISKADLSEALRTENLDPQVKQLLTIVGGHMKEGQDMTVADAAKHVVTASQQGGTPQAQAQPPQSETNSAQPEQKPTQGAPDLSKLDVKQFIAKVNTDKKDPEVVTRKEMVDAAGSKDIDSAGKQLLETVLSQIPKDPNFGIPKKLLEDRLLTVQQQQATAANAKAQGAAR